MTAQGESPDDFEIARDVFEKLRHLQRERQERVLRWVTEGLGVVNPAGGAASALAATLAATAANTGGSGAGTAFAPATLAVGTDIKSFVEAKKPRSDQQFAATVAYYYRFEAPPAQRKETIDTKSVQDAARLVGRKRLANPKSTLNNAKNAGYLDNKSRGEFAINTVGENLVVMTLPGQGRASSSKTGKKKNARKGARKTKKR